MPSSLPIIRQVAWLSLLPQLTAMALCIAIAHAGGADDPIVPGVLAFLLLSFTLRSAIPRHHRAGIKLFKQERFAEAIPHFRQSYQFFSEHRWLDRWRAVTMLSSSRIAYREMALLNVAFCLGQTGQREQSIAEYQRTLLEFPESKIAQLSLTMFGGSAPFASVRRSTNDA